MEVYDPVRHRLEKQSRVQCALEGQGMAVEEAAALGATLRVTNNGHHWTFTDCDGRVAEWWPSTGKLVFDKEWRRTLRAFTLADVMREIYARWAMQ